MPPLSKKAKTYHEDLIEGLMGSREAAAYLNAAMAVGDQRLFLLAMRNVTEAHVGMAAVSAKAKLNRENLYRILSRRGNPEFTTVIRLLHSMGLKMAVEPEIQRAKRRKIKSLA